MIRRHSWAAAAEACFVGLCLSGCLFPGDGLPKEPPPLAAMQEPTELLGEPADEWERATLAPGSFSGLETSDARATLDALLEAPEGLLVSRVVENSPAEQAGLQAGDLLLACRVLPDGAEKSLAWTSEWRGIELETAPGTAVEVAVERGGVERRATLTLVQRFRPAERVLAARLREEQRSGIVVRASTEVEARRASIAPGAGAVVVGLSEDSPWRAAGLNFEDLIVTVDGEPLPAPDVLIGRIRQAEEGARMKLGLWRQAGGVDLEVPLSEREHELREISIPPLFSYERSRDASETSVLLGLILVEQTRAAWSFRLLWLIQFSGGDADRLEKVAH
jgi:C-terminal processing protease CtpA/Prc